MVTHARAGIPWLAMLAVAAPGLLVVVLACALHQQPWAARLAQGGLLLIAVGASFLLDERSAAMVEATPRSPWWGMFARSLGLAAVLAVICGVAAAWGRAFPTPQGWLLALLPSIAAVGAVAAAALFRRLGRCAPGDLVAAAAGMLLLGLLIFGPRLGDADLLPTPGTAASGELIGWGVLLAVAVAVLAWAPTGRQPRPAVDI